MKNGKRHVFGYLLEIDWPLGFAVTQFKTDEECNKYANNLTAAVKWLRRKTGIATLQLGSIIPRPRSILLKHPSFPVDALLVYHSRLAGIEPRVTEKQMSLLNELMGREPRWLCSHPEDTQFREWLSESVAASYTNHLADQGKIPRLEITNFVDVWSPSYYTSLRASDALPELVLSDEQDGKDQTNLKEEGDASGLVDRFKGLGVGSNQDNSESLE